MLTIIAPAESQRLTTLAAIKDELRLTAGADDAFLLTLIDQASGAVRRWCNRAFAAETVQETFRLSTLTDSLMLSRWPVGAVLSVTRAGATLGEAGYEVEGATGLLYRLTDSDIRCPWLPGKIVVEYVAGFVLPGNPGRTLPEDVERAAILLVKAAWFSRNRDPLIKTEEVDGIGANSYWVGGFSDGATLPADVQGLLSAYRQPAIG